MTDSDDLSQSRYDLLTIGFYWQNRAGKHTIVSPVYPVLGALWQTTCYPGILSKKMSTDDDLRMLVQCHSYIVRAPVGTPATISRMRSEAEKADESHFVLLARARRGRERGDGTPDYSRILGGTDGYQMYQTPAGMKYACEAIERFSLLTADEYSAGARRLSLLPWGDRQV